MKKSNDDRRLSFALALLSLAAIIAPAHLLHNPEPVASLTLSTTRRERSSRARQLPSPTLRRILRSRPPATRRAILPRLISPSAGTVG